MKNVFQGRVFLKYLIVSIAAPVLYYLLLLVGASLSDLFEIRRGWYHWSIGTAYVLPLLVILPGDVFRKILFAILSVAVYACSVSLLFLIVHPYGTSNFFVISIPFIVGALMETLCYILLFKRWRKFRFWYLLVLIGSSGLSLWAIQGTVGFFLFLLGIFFWSMGVNYVIYRLNQGE